MMSALLIKNGMVCDGSGCKPPFRADVLVSGDRIAAIAPDLSPPPAVRVINAQDHLVVPGLIDAHAHSDLSLFAAPDAFGKISQGITTEINGNCGLSPFPVTDRNRSHLQSVWKKYGVPIVWNDYDSFADALAYAKPSVNTAYLCGHNTLRAAVMGYEDTPLSPQNMEEMRSLLRSAIGQGAPGLSTGLLYVPGKFASYRELADLMFVLKETDALYATHLRNEGDDLENALDEAVSLAACGSGRLHISHLKTARRENWHKLDSVLARIASAQKNGLSVTADRYPYIYSQTNLSVILPPPFDSMPDKDIQVRLNEDACACTRVIKYLDTQDRWDRVILTSAGSHTGKTVAAAASECHLSPGELIVDLLKKDSPGTMAAFDGMSADNMRRILALDTVCCGTDETARPADASLGVSHPRAFGSFPEFFNVCHRAGLPVERIISKMTSLPARIFRLEKRGLIRAGYYADLLIFQPDRYASRATFAQPHTPADGVRAVIVNGSVAYEDGVVCAGNGRVLRSV